MHPKHTTVCGKTGISIVSYYLKEEEKKLWQLLVKTFIPVTSANAEVKKEQHQQCVLKM